MPNASDRVRNLPDYPFAVLSKKIQELISRRIDVIRLDIGNPDLPPPDFVIDCLAQAAKNDNNHGYTGYVGLPAFRNAVADYYKKRFGVLIDPDNEVLPLIGSKEGILNLSLAYLDHNDIVLLPNVGYPSYYMGAQLAGASAWWIELAPEDQYLPNFDAIPSDIAMQAKMLWINYPNNPTGAIADLSFYAKAVNFCKQYDILLASDNPYVEVTFDGYSAGSLLQVPDAKEHSIEFLSLSKTYNMAGWRLGAAIGSKEILENLLKVKSNMDSGHFKPIYEAGAAALEFTSQDWLDSRNMVYRRRAEKIVEIAPKIGLHAEIPKGSLYVWARVADGNSQIYTEDALSMANVSIAPGEIYGPGGTGYVRLSLGVPDNRLDEALNRLQMWYSKRSY
ncbi:MAG: LL-diaminopimelate aminotransferase [Phototrophicales bacterium]|nr:MAG: LL-diaminopimelate aminotransferase [Phototrophicales bacterium]